METVEVTAYSVQSSSLVAGVWRYGVWIPAGTYEVVRNPAGVYRCLMPAGQGQFHEGTYYYPRETWIRDAQRAAN